MGKANRRRKQARDQKKLADGNYQLQSPDVALARAILTRQFIPARNRIDKRARAANRFERWRVNPARPAAGSPMELDDSEGFPASIAEYVTNTPVFDHAVFPAMNAAENLTTVTNLIAQWDANGQLRTTSIVALSRSALESAARAIWILSPTDRDDRRARALRITKYEVDERRKYLMHQVDAITRSGRDPHNELDDLRTGRDRCEAIVKELSDVATAPGHVDVIVHAAKWLDTNLAPHEKPMADASRSMYSIASGIAHGFTWTTNHVRQVTDLTNLVADFLYVANTATEGAVALCEALSAANGQISDTCPPHLKHLVEKLHIEYS